MGDQSQKQKSMMDDARHGFNVVTAFFNSHATTITPFTHTGFGVRGMEGYSVGAFLMIVAWAGLVKSPFMLWCYLPAWLVMVIIRKVKADPQQHSSYQGYPWLTGWMTRDEYHARCAEAALMPLFGGLLSALDQGAGLFVFFGILSLGGKYILEFSIHERRIRAARDWQVEAEQWQDAVKEAARRQKGRR